MSTRFRKAFRYPEDDDREPDELDEHDQETLIQELQAHDDSSSLFYRRAFLTLPLISALVYLPLVFTANSFRQVLLAVLALTSLASTAYILHYLPDSRQPQTTRSTLLANNKSPLDKSLPPLNTALSALLTLVAVLAWGRDWLDEAWRAFLPPAVFAFVMYARSQMAPLDVGGLERLKYNYKGA